MGEGETEARREGPAGRDAAQKAANWFGEYISDIYQIFRMLMLLNANTFVKRSGWRGLESFGCRQLNFWLRCGVIRSRLSSMTQVSLALMKTGGSAQGVTNVDVPMSLTRRCEINKSPAHCVSSSTTASRVRCPSGISRMNFITAWNTAGSCRFVMGTLRALEASPSEDVAKGPDDADHRRIGRVARGMMSTAVNLERHCREKTAILVLFSFSTVPTDTVSCLS